MIRPFLSVIPRTDVAMSVQCLIIKEAVVEDNRVQYMMGVCEQGWTREIKRTR